MKAMTLHTSNFDLFYDQYYQNSRCADLIEGRKTNAIKCMH
jgi:hypothetical protein